MRLGSLGCLFLPFLSGGWLLIVWVGTEREEGGKGANAESTQYRL